MPDLPFIDEHAVDVAASIDDLWAAVQRFHPPAFHVELAAPPTELVLAGRHPFARYALTFRIDDVGDGRARLRAESRAVFPGIHGRLYRLAVIGTRFHVLAVRRLLRGIQRDAEAS